MTFTETSWPEEDDPERLIGWLSGPLEADAGNAPPPHAHLRAATRGRPDRPSDRKFRLYSCACFDALLARRRLRDLDEKALRHAEEMADKEEGDHKWDGTFWVNHPEAASAACAGACMLRPFNKKLAVRLVHEIMGNPFRWKALQRWRWSFAIKEVMTWNGGTVPNMARIIYLEKAFDRLPVLADALEDAGADLPDLLSHLRSPGPHVRGCWALDLVLGKE
jgi:hypothetical protein